MGPEEINKAAITLANQAANAQIGLSGPQRDQFVAAETQKNIAAIRGGTTPVPAPAENPAPALAAPGPSAGPGPKPGAPEPAPANKNYEASSAAAPPKLDEGQQMIQGGNLFKVINGQPVYQGPAPQQ